MRRQRRRRMSKTWGATRTCVYCWKERLSLHQHHVMIRSGWVGMVKSCQLRFDRATTLSHVFLAEWKRRKKMCEHTRPERLVFVRDYCYQRKSNFKSNFPRPGVLLICQHSSTVFRLSTICSFNKSSASLSLPRRTERALERMNFFTHRLQAPRENIFPAFLFVSFVQKKNIYP